MIGPLSGKLALYCSDASISRYLEARSWNVKKAVKMLKASLKWRLNCKPEEILWVLLQNPPPLSVMSFFTIFKRVCICLFGSYSLMNLWNLHLWVFVSFFLSFSVLWRRENGIFVN